MIEELDQIFSVFEKQEKTKQPQEKQPFNQPNNLQPLIQNEIDKLDKIKTLTKDLIYQKVQIETKGQLEALSKVKELVDDPNFFDEKLNNKVFLLARFQKPIKLKNQSQGQDKTPMKNTLKRSLAAFKYEIVEYDQLIPLNALWNDYMKQLIGNEKIQDNIYQKFLRADFHGAIIQICYSKCKSYEGIEGIVLEEKLKAFIIITKQNKKLLILKQNTIFLVPVGDRTFKLHGCHFVFRSADRIKQDFKYHKASQFVLDHM